MRVLFWGTPEFATPALRALIGEGFEVAAVITQPDKPVGRSRSTVHPSAVKEVAVEEGITVLQPERPRGDAFVQELRALEADLSVVVAYGHILPKEVIELPRRGTWNIHGSLLPALRGAAPIQAAIREGARKTGVSIMRMVERLDAGPVILRLETDILDDETFGELALRLSELGATALIEALALMELGKTREEPQDETLATYAPKIDRNQTRITWTSDAATIGRVIRAYDPRPGAFSEFAGTTIKFFGARGADASAGGKPGEIVAVSGDGIVIACGSGALRIQQVQPEGKKRMPAADWARGRGESAGQRFV